MEIKKKFTPRLPMSVHKKFQSIRSSRLASFRDQMYECLVLLYRRYGFSIRTDYGFIINSINTFKDIFLTCCCFDKVPLWVSLFVEGSLEITETFLCLKIYSILWMDLFELFIDEVVNQKKNFTSANNLENEVFKLIN